MARFRLSRLAEADLLHILRTSAERWGAEGARRYASLLAEAMRKVATDPQGPTTRARNDLHPGVRLELTTTTAMVSLTKRDADLAVRPTRKPPPNLVGRRVSPLAFALYAAPSYLARVPAKRDLARHTWLAPDDSLATTTIARWMARAVPGDQIALRADTLTALAYAAAAGIGVVALPCYLGDSLAQLRRVRGVIPEMASELWVLTHEDLRGTARIRVVNDALVTALVAQQPLFAGQRPA